MIHWSWLDVACRSRTSVGSATLRMVLSTLMINAARHTMARASRRCWSRWPGIVSSTRVRRLMGQFSGERGRATKARSQSDPSPLCVARKVGQRVAVDRWEPLGRVHGGQSFLGFSIALRNQGLPKGLYRWCGCRGPEKAPSQISQGMAASDGLRLQEPSHIFKQAEFGRGRSVRRSRPDDSVVLVARDCREEPANPCPRRCQ